MDDMVAKVLLLRALGSHVIVGQPQPATFAASVALGALPLRCGIGVADISEKAMVVCVKKGSL